MHVYMYTQGQEYSLGTAYYYNTGMYCFMHTRTHCNTNGVTPCLWCTDMYAPVTLRKVAHTGAITPTHVCNGINNYTNRTW
jgi:hypothetical protein